MAVEVIALFVVKVFVRAAKAGERRSNGISHQLIGLADSNAGDQQGSVNNDEEQQRHGDEGGEGRLQKAADGVADYTTGTTGAVRGKAKLRGASKDVDQAEHGEDDDADTAHNARLKVPRWAGDIHHQGNGQGHQCHRQHPGACTNDVADDIAHPGAYLAGNAKPDGSRKHDGNTNKNERHRIRIFHLNTA